MTQPQTPLGSGSVEEEFPKTPPVSPSIAGDIGKWWSGNWLPAVISFLIVVAVAITISLPFWSFRGGLEVVTWALLDEKLPAPDQRSTGERPSTPGGADEASVSSAIQSEAVDSWRVKGRVLRDGSPLKGVLVWAVATDRLGSRFSPKPVTTDASGGFEFEPIPGELRRDRIEKSIDVKVRAKECVPVPESLTTPEQQECAPKGSLGLQDGEDTLTLGATGSTRKVGIAGLAIFPIPIIFIISIIIAIAQPNSQGNRKWQYYGSIFLAILFTSTMVGYILVGLSRISGIGAPGEILTLGFLNFFHDTYVSDVGKAWLVTLTSEASAFGAISETAQSGKVGFGAPLWVILMSVIGSASFTMLLLVGQITSKLNFDDPKDIRKRVHQFTMHQVYTLFAPLGAVIVYQTLVIGKAASQEVTVGIIALASGLGINLVLNRAYRTVVGLLGDTKPGT